MALPTYPPVPYPAPWLEGDDKPVAHDSYIWLSGLVQQQQSTARIVTAKRFVNQASSLAATGLNVTGAGVYRVTWYLRVTQPASVSSSVTVTITATDQGNVCQQAGPAVTGNTVTTVQSGFVDVETDAASPVTVSAAYASIGATPLLYTLIVTCEQIA